MGKRKGSHGSDTWSFPGGHLEFGESPEACAARELFEETDIQLNSFKRASVFTDDIFDSENKHYITLYLLAEHNGQEPILKEPEKCSEWKWYDWENLPKPLFLCVENLIKQNFKPNINAGS